MYLARLWYADHLNEPIRQILRASALPAVEHLGAVSRAIEGPLRSRGPIGRLACLALEDSVGVIENLKSTTVATFERASLLGRLGVRSGQRRFVAFLNAYERDSIAFVMTAWLSTSTSPRTGIFGNGSASIPSCYRLCAS